MWLTIHFLQNIWARENTGIHNQMQAGLSSYLQIKQRNLSSEEDGYLKSPLIALGKPKLPLPSGIKMLKEIIMIIMRMVHSSYVLTKCQAQYLKGIALFNPHNTLEMGIIITLVLQVSLETEVPENSICLDSRIQ